MRNLRTQKLRVERWWNWTQVFYNSIKKLVICYLYILVLRTSWRSRTCNRCWSPCRRTSPSSWAACCRCSRWHICDGKCVPLQLLSQHGKPVGHNASRLSTSIIIQCSWNYCGKNFFVYYTLVTTILQWLRHKTFCNILLALKTKNTFQTLKNANH